MHGTKKQGEVAGQLHSAAIHLLRRLRLQDERAGVGPAKLSALSVLVFGGPRSLGELARLEQVKPPTMSRIVDGLERDGFARRESDEADGRSTNIVATRKGSRVLREARARRVEDLSRRLAGLAPIELETLQRAAEIIGRAL